MPATTARNVVVLGARNLGGAILDHGRARGWRSAAVVRSEETAKTVEARGHHAIRADAGDPAQLDLALTSAAERLGGPLDAIVNAASPGARPGSTFGGGAIADATPEDFEHYGITVARQAFAFLSSGARALRDNPTGGALVQITGGSARRAIPGRGPWAAGAFATRALTQAAAQELREDGIHAALLIVDGTISSPKTAGFTADAPEGSLVRQEDVAAAVAYLIEQKPHGQTHELTLTPAGDRWVP